MRTRIGNVFVPVLALAVSMIAAVVTPASWASGQIRTAGTPSEGVPAFGHVFLIIGENTTYSHLTPANAPFLMGTIRPQAAWLSSYYAATHWSQANYVAMVTGQFTRCEQRDGGIACHQNVGNLFHQLDLAGLTWNCLLYTSPSPRDS